ncbi:hypothetical protein LPJ53_005139 [Coemansia erecta]|uniref:Major facilitator superfamily (MFS) profile domain-containing protein n=1 Tax=Coemansia erecta TaxID=147472 RepID=A0A9W8CQV5_9FUNG|nr:hypothetical protein LPJ53_005139 [Coemansia erecta]
MTLTGRASDASDTSAVLDSSGAHETVEESPLLHTATVEAQERGDSTSSPRSLDAGITMACVVSAAAVCFAPLQYGYHIAELNTPRKIITGCDKDAAHWGSLPLCLPMNDAIYSLATSIFAIGGLVGSLGAGWMAEKWGRRGALVLNNAPFVLGPLLMAFAVSPSMLIVGRFVSGVGSGAAVVIAPMYLSEIAPVRFRGTLNLLNQLSIVVGILITLTVGMLANEGPYWRISVGFGIIFALVHMAISGLAVESPRYLWSRNRRAEARAVLCRLRQTSNIDDEVSDWSATPVSDTPLQPSTELRSPSDDSLRAVQTVNRGESGHTVKPDDDEGLGDTLQVEKVNVTIFNIFRFSQYRKPWVLVLLLQFGQQLSGINTVFYYSSSVLEKMFSSRISSILTMMIGVLNVLATASGALIVDRFGRRPLLFSSMGSMAVSITLLGLGLGLKINTLAAVSLYLVVASFAPGYGPVPFLLGTEFFDIRAAGAGGSWALAANWVGTFIVATAFLPLQNLIGEWVFSIFVVCLAVCGAVFYFHVPETKGRTIEEISRSFK